MKVEKLLINEKSYNGDLHAREGMHNAATIAGMAFTNAFLGLNHAMAHQLGATFHIPHGRANAILLPHIILYNGGATPTKFTAFPKYKKFTAPERYQAISRELGLPAKTPAEGVRSLAEACTELMRRLEMPLTSADCGIKRKALEARLDEIANKAFLDQCLGTNPRFPLVEEIRDLFIKALT